MKRGVITPPAAGAPCQGSGGLSGSRKLFVEAFVGPSRDGAEKAAQNLHSHPVIGVSCQQSQRRSYRESFSPAAVACGIRFGSYGLEFLCINIGSQARTDMDCCELYF